MVSIESPQLFNDLDSDTTLGGRVLRREWKKCRPHLQKSASLPNLQLPPLNRPMFSCLQCGFTNTLGIPLCPWCFWTSDNAKEAYERSESELRRLRRVSAPPRVFWKPSDLAPLPAPSVTRPNAVSRPLMSELRSRGSEPVITSSSEGTPSDARTSATRVLSGHLTSKDSNEQHSYATKTRSRPHRKQSSNGDRAAQDENKGLNCYDDTGLLGVPTTTAHLNGCTARPVVIVSSDAPQESVSPASSKGFEALQNIDQRPRPALPKDSSNITTRPHPTDSMTSPTAFSGVDHLFGMSHVKTTSMQSLRSAHLVIDIKPFNSNYGTLHANIPLNLHDPQQSRPPSAQTLRRKGHVSVFRISNSSAGITSVFDSESEETDSRQASSTFLRPPSSSTTGDGQSFRTHSRAKSQPINIPQPNVPLGHPSRPYYTAIRPDKMSPPVSSSYNPSSWGRGRLSFQPLPPTQRPMSLPNQSTIPARCTSPGIYSVLSAPCPGSADATTTAYAYLRPETPVLDPAMLDSPPSPSRSHFNSLSRLFTSKRRPATSMGLYEPTNSPDSELIFSSSPKLKFQQAHAALAGSISKSRHMTGFSLSGETELRMALASARKEAACGASTESNHGHGGRGRSRTVAGDEFRFKETGTLQRRGSIGNVARKVKDGFREFVKRRGLSTAC